MKTWHWSDEVFKEAITKLVNAIPDNEQYCIPYEAGYNKDGTKIYIDKHVPKEFIRHLKVHEIIEKLLEDHLHLEYFYAHQIALRVEKAAVEADGYDWKTYDKETSDLDKYTEHEPLTNLPPDLDLLPYEAEHDTKGIRRAMK